MENTLPREIFDRKQKAQEDFNEEMNKRIPPYRKMEMILTSENADMLTDEDLYNHYRNINNKKRISFLALVAIPAAFYYKYQTFSSILKSFLVTALFTRWYYTHPSFDRQSDYSFEFAINSQKRFDSKILKYNGKRFMTKHEKWNGRKDNLNMRQWIQLNTYH